MLEFFAEVLLHPFMRRAVIVGFLISLCAALLGTTLVLKRYSMIGDGLSHVGFGALAIASAAGVAPLHVALPVVVAAAFLLLRISESGKIKGDAAIALISTGSLAVGVIAASMSGTNTDLNSYLFGSVLVMSDSDVTASAILSIFVLVVFVFFYSRIFAVTFDERFAKATGTRTGILNMLIASMTAVTIVLGMRMMGALLMSSLVVFPAMSAMQICKRFKLVVITSAIVSVLCYTIGMFISYYVSGLLIIAGLFIPYGLSIPPGASVVTVNIVALGLFSAIARLSEKLGKKETADN